MGDGTTENPYTREDVLRLIKENGGTAQGLDLSGKVFEPKIDLCEFDLRGVILNKARFAVRVKKGTITADTGAQLQKAKLMGANLQGASLRFINLQKADLSNANLKYTNLSGAHLEGAILTGAHLKVANLLGAHLEGADLSFAHFEGAALFFTYLDGALLWSTQFSPDSRLEGIRWGNYILEEERDESFLTAAITYRQLKQWHTNAGMYDIAAKFYYREMEAKRKALKYRPNPLSKIRQTLYWLLCGYGEIPWRVFGWAGAVVVGLALIYFAIGTLTPNTFLNSLYYSAVSFTALGYGSWAPEPTGWVKGLGAFEAFIGVFTMALFLITFTRKMTR